MSNIEETQKLFQYALVGIFIAFAVIGTIFLATTRSGDSGRSNVTITIWGPPLFTDDAQRVFSVLTGDPESPLHKVEYVTKHPDTLYAEAVEAMATDRGPDIIIYDAGMLLSIRDKLYGITYETYPMRTFRDTFVEGAEVFALQDGIYALPLFVDPLVLFWNRNSFTDAAVAQVPRDWNTFVATVPRLTRIVDGATVVRSGIAFGEHENVLHAKEILVSLIMQTGNALVKEEEVGYRSMLHTENTATPPALALRFYTDFANPVKTVYSWNNTFPVSRDAFAAGDVAMYVGFASEVRLIAEMNPNLNFDIAPLPQSATGMNQATYGTFYGGGVLKTSRNPNEAFMVLQELTTPAVTAHLATHSLMAPVRRDMLVPDPADARSEVLVRSAIIAKTWLEPRLSGMTDEYVGAAIRAVVTGQETPQVAVEKLNRNLQVLLDSYE
jgi:ABC-type glycerol-3-phosphate transport system substrate-binding protein